MEAGLQIRMAAALLGRLSYRFEQARVTGGPRETVEGLAVGVSYLLR
jgi:hypothetical protein